MNRPAFTLIELVAVMVIVAIVAVTAVPSLSSLNNSRRAAAAQQVVRDLTYAREHAQATGTPTWILFNVAGQSWSILAEDPDNPGRANATAMIHPGTGRVYEMAVSSGSFVTVSLVSADFDGGSEVGFDWQGRPLSADEVLLTSAGTVTLSGGAVTVEPGTGLVR